MSLKMRPIARDYDPGYPAMVEIRDWRALLERSSRAVFEPRTLAFAGLLGTSLLIPTPARADLSQYLKYLRPAPVVMKADNPAAQAIANWTLAAVDDRGGTLGALMETRTYVAGNPDITVPDVMIMFGNATIGVFDLHRARAVTAEIFRAYGLDPQADYPMKGEGLEFHVDGYDPEAGVGFEIVGGEYQPLPWYDQPEPAPEIPDNVLLDAAEQKRVMSAVEGKALKLLMVPVSDYSTINSDENSPLEAYLRTVLDYLDWLKANGQL